MLDITFEPSQTHPPIESINAPTYPGLTSAPTAQKEVARVSLNQQLANAKLKTAELFEQKSALLKTQADNILSSLNTGSFNLKANSFTINTSPLNLNTLSGLSQRTPPPVAKRKFKERVEYSDSKLADVQIQNIEKEEETNNNTIATTEAQIAALG